MYVDMFENEKKKIKKNRKTEKKQFWEENLPGIFGTIGLTTMAVDWSRSQRAKDFKNINRKTKRKQNVED